MVNNKILSVDKILGIYMFTILLVIAYFSFGNFGYLNLLGIRELVQFSVILFSFHGVFVLPDVNKHNKRILKWLFMFVVYVGIVNIVVHQSLELLLLIWLMFVFSAFVLVADFKWVISITKKIVIVAFLFSVMGFFAFFSYVFNPELLYSTDLYAYTSDTGSGAVNSDFYLDYFSLAVDGNMDLFGIQVPRMRSFSSEPSATLVHMLVPGVLSLFLDYRYRILGFVIILFNLFAILSLTTIIVFFVAFLIYPLFLYSKKIFIYFSLGAAGFSIMLAASNVGLVVQMIDIYGSEIHQNTSFNLIATKKGSANIRLVSLNDAIDEIKTHPFGGSNMQSMTGVLVSFGLKGGVVLILLYLAFAINIVNRSHDRFRYCNNDMLHKYAISLVVSMIVVVSLISNHGWDRVPGWLAFLLFYRHVSMCNMNSSKVRQYPNSYSSRHLYDG